jgi:hypothetical protein
VGLVHGGDVAKPRYFRQAGERERAKNTWGRNLTPSQDFVRTRPEFQGGTAVVGLPVAGAWQFWFQTWGDVTYERMNSAKAVAAAIIDWKSIHRRIWSGKKHQASYATMAVVDHGRFYP